MTPALPNPEKSMMKIKIRRLPVFGTLLLSLFIFGTPAILEIGCRTAPQTAYAMAGVATVTVEEGLGLWNIYVGAKHPGVAAELKVKAAYQNYQSADIALLKAGRAMLEANNSQDPNSLSTAKADWQRAEAALTAAAADVYTLLKKLGVKLP
jgi:hypothetical protein